MRGVQGCVKGCDRNVIGVEEGWRMADREGCEGWRRAV